MERAELATLEMQPGAYSGYASRRLRYLRLSIPDLEERVSRDAPPPPTRKGAGADPTRPPA